jgi:hypothetical protein
MRCAYLLLSGAYRDAASDARERGWRVEEIVGAQHLHLVVAPATVTDVLIGLPNEAATARGTSFCRARSPARSPSMTETCVPHGDPCGERRSDGRP